uniref:RNA-directed DNA polymerase n=1 Tax=Caenorhabditis japonica TaxID=281687 RepID=A0A8R1I018_CAEJA
MFVSTFNQSITRIEATGIETCRLMISERRVEGRTLQRVDPVTFATDMENEPWADRTFATTTCISVPRFVIQKGTVSKFGETLISPLLINTASCTLSEGICANDAAMVLWTPPSPGKCNPTAVATHDAQVSATTIIIPSAQAAFHLNADETPAVIQRCFDQPVHTTTSSVLITFEDERPRKRHRRSSTTAHDLLDIFMNERKTFPQLTLRQFHQGWNRLPVLIKNLNITETTVERHIRLHPSKDTSLVILHTLVEAESLQAKKKNLAYPHFTFQDTPIDYSPTEAEAWITLSRILFREISKPLFVPAEPLPNTTKKPEAISNFIGSPEHVNYLKVEYDKRAEQRRNLSTTSNNARLQYNTEMLQNDLRQNFEKLSTALCETTNRQLSIWNAILRIDATTGIRTILNRQDVNARFVGLHTLYVSQCTKIDVIEVIRSRRIGDTCFAKTPVITLKNETLFFNPGSRDLTHSSSQVPCDEVSVWETDNGLVEASGKRETVHTLEPFLRLNVSLQRINLTKHEVILGGYTFNAATNTIAETVDEIKGFYKEYAIVVGSILCVLCVMTGIAYLIIRKLGVSIGIFHVNTNSRRNSEELTTVCNVSAEPTAPEEDYQREVQPFLPRLPPVMTYLPIVMAFVNTVGSSSLPYVPISLKDRLTVALWDSGSSISYLRKSTMMYINELKFNKSVNQAATAANGSKFEFLGSTTLPIRIGSTHLETPFLISRDEHCPANVLLGFDFMAQLEKIGVPTTLLPGQKKMIVGKSLVPLIRQGDRAYKHTRRIVNIVAASDTELKPGARQNLRITFDTDEPLHLRSVGKSPVRFNECIIDPWLENTANVTVINHGPTIRAIKEGETLGHARTVKRPTFVANKSSDAITPVPQLINEETSPEADWTTKLPNPPASDDLFRKELDIKSSCLSHNNSDKLIALIHRHETAFYNKDGSLGHFSGPIQHTIELDKPLPKPRKGRIPYSKREEVARQVEEFRRLKIIEPSTSTFTSPIVLVKKKDSTFRFTVDYRTLNSATRKENYIIPHVAEILDLAANSHVFSSFDFISGFFQIELRKEDRPLTAFETEEGTFQFRVMPMGVCGAPHTFQQVARYLQKNVKAKLFAYLDDLLLVSQSEEEHLQDLDNLLTLISDCGLKLKLSKCCFARKELEFLGYIIGRDGLKPNPKKVYAIQHYPTPIYPTAVRSFLGLVGYFRRFIANFAGIASPLHELTEKKNEFVWTDEHQSSFDFLRQALLNPPILVGPNLTKPYIVECDASLMAVAGALLQKNDEKQIQVIAYASRKLNPAERRYPPIEAEALAIVFCLQHFRQYVLGSHTVVITDHKPLTSLLHRKDLDGRLQKYQLSIQDYDIEIIYRPGRHNVIADALSRYFEDETNEPAVHAVQLERSDVVTAEEVREAQNETEWIKDAIAAILDNADSRKGRSWRNRFTVRDGMLRQKHDNNTIIIPRDHPIKSHIVKRYHESSIHGGHLAVEKTLDVIRRHFYWTNMRMDVQDAVRRCLPCQRRKTNPHDTTVEPSGPVTRFSQPAEHWHIDHLGPLPITENGNRYVLCFRDAFSRYLITTPVQSQDSQTSSEEFIKNIIAIHGTPTSVTTDHGTSFTSELFRTTLKDLGIEHIRSAPYHHQSNGIVERANRTLEESLSSYVNHHQTDWDAFLPLVTFAINSSTTVTTKNCPFEVMFGRKPTLPENNVLNIRTLFGEDYTTNLRQRLHELWDQMRTLAEEQDHKTPGTKRRTLARDVRKGDLILVKRQAPKNKLAPRLVGPCTVKEVTSKNVTFLLDGAERIAHKDDTRLFARTRQHEEEEEEEDDRPSPRSSPASGSPPPSRRSSTSYPIRRSARLQEKTNVK